MYLKNLPLKKDVIKPQYYEKDFFIDDIIVNDLCRILPNSRGVF